MFSTSPNLDTSYNSPNEFARSSDEADAQKGPVLFGNKRRSVAVSRTPSFMSNANPIVGISSPSTDIFASPAPAQSALPSHMRESTPSGGKSVHWSPALVADRNLSSPLVKPSQGISTSSSTAPPLRSLREDNEPVTKSSRRSLSTTVTHPLNQSNTSIIMGTTDAPENQEPSSTSDNWVTVFGFSQDQAYAVLQFMSRHGEVVQHQIPPKGNWMHIGYSCSTHARQALSRNGTVVDGFLRIGVIPTPEKELSGFNISSPIPVSNLNRSTVIEQSIREEPEEDIVLTTRDQNSTLDTSLNNSRLSMASRAGMRPLNNSFRRHADVEMQEKQSSFMSKLWNTVGF